MNRPKFNITYRRYLGPALYDLIRAEDTQRILPVTTGQINKLAKEKV